MNTDFRARCFWSRFSRPSPSGWLCGQSPAGISLPPPHSSFNKVKWARAVPWVAPLPTPDPEPTCGACPLTSACGPWVRMRGRPQNTEGAKPVAQIWTAHVCSYTLTCMTQQHPHIVCMYKRVATHSTGAHSPGSGCPARQTPTASPPLDSRATNSLITRPPMGALGQAAGFCLYSRPLLLPSAPRKTGCLKPAAPSFPLPRAGFTGVRAPQRKATAHPAASPTSYAKGTRENSACPFGASNLTKKEKSWGGL